MWCRGSVKSKSFRNVFLSWIARSINLQAIPLLSSEVEVSRPARCGAPSPPGWLLAEARRSRDAQGSLRASPCPFLLPACWACHGRPREPVVVPGQRGAPGPLPEPRRGRPAPPRSADLSPGGGLGRWAVRPRLFRRRQLLGRRVPAACQAAPLRSPPLPAAAVPRGEPGRVGAAPAPPRRPCPREQGLRGRPPGGSPPLGGSAGPSRRSDLLCCALLCLPRCRRRRQATG